MTRWIHNQQLLLATVEEPSRYLKTSKASRFATLKQLLVRLGLSLKKFKEVWGLTSLDLKISAHGSGLKFVNMVYETVSYVKPLTRLLPPPQPILGSPQYLSTTHLHSERAKTQKYNLQ